MPELSYLQAIVLGVLQGVTELFPVSSLGHAVLIPAWLGGDWQSLVTQYTTGDSGQSPYLAFVVAMHVATALALLWFYRADWNAIVRAGINTVRTRSISTPTERLAWLLVVATIPVCITGVVLEHVFRVLFATPAAAAAFLTVNGLVLFLGERLRRRGASRAGGVAESPAPVRVPVPVDVPADGAAQAALLAPAGIPGTRPLATLGYPEAALIGLFQTLALLAGISRSGITMVGGLVRGLDHEDAARFAFLLATPVILGAGVLKIPSLLGPAGAHIHGQVVVGALTAGVAAFLSVRFLTRWFTTRTLTPFAWYCVIFGGLSLLHFA